MSPFLLNVITNKFGFISTKLFMLSIPPTPFFFPVLFLYFLDSGFHNVLQKALEVHRDHFWQCGQGLCIHGSKLSCNIYGL